jgi:hypothetical protein
MQPSRATRNRRLNSDNDAFRNVSARVKASTLALLSLLSWGSQHDLATRHLPNQ